MGPSTWRSFRRVTAVAVTSCAVMTAIAGGAAADTPPGTTVVTTQSLTWTCGWSNGCVNAGWWPLGTGDMNGDGHRDMVWQNETTRKVDTWLLDGKGRVTGSKTITGATAPVKAQAVIADMNGDGVTDIVIWGSAQVPPVIWLLDGDGHVTTTQSVPSGCDASGSEPCGLIGGAGADLNADGHTDIVSHNWTTGVLTALYLNGAGGVIGTQALSWTCALPDCAGYWWPDGFADVNGDGHPDLTWDNSHSGVVSSWLLGPGGVVTGTQDINWTCSLSSGCSNSWKPVGVGDMNDDHQPDFTWWNTTTGEVSSWLLNPTMPLSLR